jgi:uncharacterized protein YqeY
MGFVEMLHEQLKAAMKSGDTGRRDTFRLLQSALKNAAIELRKPATELSDEEALGVVRRLVKQRKDSIEQYQAGGREDLVAVEAAELEILTTFLPAEMPEAEVKKIVAEAINESGATSRKDIGRVMGVAMKKIAGRASGDMVKNAVMDLLPEA